MGTLMVMEISLVDADKPGYLKSVRTYREATDADIIKAYNEIIRKRDKKNSEANKEYIKRKDDDDGIEWDSINMEEDCAELGDWESTDDSAN